MINKTSTKQRLFVLAGLICVLLIPQTGASSLGLESDSDCESETPELSGDGTMGINFGNTSQNPNNFVSVRRNSALRGGIESEMRRASVDLTESQGHISASVFGSAQVVKQTNGLLVDSLENLGNVNKRQRRQDVQAFQLEMGGIVLLSLILFSGLYTAKSTIEAEASLEKLEDERLPLYVKHVLAKATPTHEGWYMGLFALFLALTMVLLKIKRKKCHTPRKK